MLDRLFAFRRRYSEQVQPAIESLESRQLLSGGSGFHDGRDDARGAFGRSVTTIEFNQAPAAVQNGLDTLATRAGLAPPAATSTQTVFLNNLGGTEVFSMDITGAGTETILTVDQFGNAYTKPVRSSTTWATLSGSGTGSNAAATAEISAIATALNLTTPTATTAVRAVTQGTKVVYSVSLSKISTTSSKRRQSFVTIAVDQNGNPAGNQDLPFSVMPSAVQAGINTNRPTGATALDASSTQTVQVRTKNGVLSYTAAFTSTGTTTNVSVNSSGQLTALPTTSTAVFSAIPQAEQTQLQTLATANGYSGTIAAAQSVSVYDEANGTVLYTVRLPATKMNKSGTTYTINIAVTSDQSGNPTTLPRGGYERFNFGGFQHLDLGGFGGFAQIISGHGAGHRR